MNTDVATVRIPPGSARTVELGRGDELVILDPEGQQVSDLVAFGRPDSREYLSSGRSLDRAAHLWLTTGDVLYSNRSRPMLTIIEDTCGRHDFTLTSCSKDTSANLYGSQKARPGCEAILAAALAPYHIDVDQIPITFNVFMHVAIDVTTGKFEVLPPLSTAGDLVRFRAEMPMVVAMTACSAGQPHHGRIKPIDFQVVRNRPKQVEAANDRSQFNIFSKITRLPRDILGK